MSDDARTYVSQVAVGDGLASLWRQRDGSYIISDDPPPDDLEEEFIKNPRMKALSDENAAHRTKNKELTAQIQELTRQLAEGPSSDDDATEQLRARTVEAAMLRSIMASPQKIRDVDAALQLADVTGVEVAEDGTVTGAEEAVAKALERYPFLVDDSESESPDKTKPGFNDQPSGSPMNKRVNRSTGPDRQQLIDKYSALRNRR
jgi:hypothetical protein